MSEIIQQQDSRRIFIDTLCELAEKDNKIVLIVCDVGFNYIEEFQKQFPNRFFNFGVTEQSSALIAAGLALSGFKPYFYSMINFVLFRPYEMVRNGICYHNANVKLIGVKGSEKYRFLGLSHNLLGSENEEDLLKNLPNIKRYYPDTIDKIKEVMLKSYQEKTPTYIRL